MTDCCLLVCCRPRSYKRLLKDAYPINTTAAADIKPHESRLTKLIDYLNLYPRKIPLLCQQLYKRICHDFTYSRAGKFYIVYSRNISHTYFLLTKIMINQ